MRTTYCGLVSEKLMDQTVTLMGWAHTRRDHGGVIFIDLRDRTGLVQTVAHEEQADARNAADEALKYVISMGVVVPGAEPATAARN